MQFGLRVVASEHVPELRKSLMESGRLESVQNSLEKGLENAQKRTGRGSKRNKYGIGARIWERKGKRPERQVRRGRRKCLEEEFKV